MLSRAAVEDDVIADLKAQLSAIAQVLDGAAGMNEDVIDLRWARWPQAVAFRDGVQCAGATASGRFISVLAGQAGRHG
jgi:hypothetical protein